MSALQSFSRYSCLKMVSAMLTRIVAYSLARLDEKEARERRTLSLKPSERPLPNSCNDNVEGDLSPVDLLQSLTGELDRELGSELLGLPSGVLRVKC